MTVYTWRLVPHPDFSRRWTINRPASSRDFNLAVWLYRLQPDAAVRLALRLQPGPGVTDDNGARDVLNVVEGRPGATLWADGDFTFRLLGDTTP